jgi:cytochrome c-type biogenesis protein CcmH/NrfG
MTVQICKLIVYSTLRESLKQEGDTLETTYLLGVAYLWLGEYEKAKTVYQCITRRLSYIV